MNKAEQIMQAGGLNDRQKITMSEFTSFTLCHVQLVVVMQIVYTKAEFKQ